MTPPDFVDKMVELGHSLGWNGVENSKILEVFLKNHIADLQNQVESWKRAFGEVVEARDQLVRERDEVLKSFLSDARAIRLADERSDKLLAEAKALRAKIKALEDQAARDAGFS